MRGGIDKAGAGHRDTPILKRRDDAVGNLCALESISEPAGVLMLPGFATAGDIRETVKFLKKRPVGVTIVEAMHAEQRRIFEPGKVAAYEYWGIVTKSGERFKLTPLGLALAEKLELEVPIYRTVIDNVRPYKLVLEWALKNKLESITREEVEDYWREKNPQELILDNERMVEASIISFFHICQAASLGTVVIGKRGQRGRLHLERDELVKYFRRISPLTTNQPPMPETRAESLSHNLLISRGLNRASEDSVERPILIFSRELNEITVQVNTILEILGAETEVVKQQENDSGLVNEQLTDFMRRCEAGIIVVSREDCFINQTGATEVNSAVLIGIGAAYVLYERRLLIIWNSELPVPTKLQRLNHFQFNEERLTWENIVQLMRAIKAL